MPDQNFREKLEAVRSARIGVLKERREGYGPPENIPDYADSGSITFIDMAILKLKRVKECLAAAHSVEQGAVGGWLTPAIHTRSRKLRDQAWDNLLDSANYVEFAAAMEYEEPEEPAMEVHEECTTGQVSSSVSSTDEAWGGYKNYINDRVQAALKRAVGVDIEDNRDGTIIFTVRV